MTKPASSLFVVFAVAVVVLGSLLLPAASVAQETGSPWLRIAKVDVQRFPNVEVYVLGQNLDADLASAALTLAEDGRIQPVLASEMVEVGGQTVFLLDASEDIRKLGETNVPRYEEVSEAVRRLVDDLKILNQADWVAAYAPSAAQRIEAIKDWTNDPGFLRNNLYSYVPVQGIGETPLFELIYFGLESFKDPQLAAGAERSMVLFSDGIDNVSGLEINDAIQRANDMGVRIHTVQLGPAGGGGRGNLERIAILTGGQFVALNAVEALDPIWDTIAQGRQQRRLSYRTGNVQPKELTVTGQTERGPVEGRSAFPPPPPLDPVDIQIAQPAAGQQVVRRGDFYTATLAALTPAVLPIEVAFSWPDGNPRAIRRVEYSVGSDTRVVEAEPFDRIEFPIETLGEGTYAVRVQAVDELGLVGLSDPYSVRVLVDKPPQPTPVPAVINIDDLPCEGLLCQQNMRWLTLASLALALVALFFAIFVLLRKPAVRSAVQDAWTGTIKAVTQPFTLDRRMKGQQAAKAKLVLFEGDAHLPQTIEIQGSNTRIGRDSNLSNVVLDDPRVSRYHCRISEEADGSFRIFDEGSTSGTYVNYKPVDIRGQVLQHGDQLHIGPIGLRFELSQPGAEEPADATEIYTPQFDASEAEDDDPFKTEPFRLYKPERKDE